MKRTSTTCKLPRKHPITASNRSFSRRRFVGGALALPVATAFARFPAQTNGPYVLVLGTAQDAGVPQVNCFSPNCEAARRGLRPRPRVASLGVVDPREGRRFLIDATPDFVEQTGDLLLHPEGNERPTGSLRLEEHLHGVFLTHAHMGHYTGLIHTGREGAASHDLPLYASTRMLSYLRANEPWAFLFDNDHVEGFALEPGRAVELTRRLRITPVDVVHRQEFADTLGYLIEGPERSLLYVPDADVWEGWTVSLETWLDRADIALLDGSFFSYDELGHRPQGDVPHPPVITTIELLEQRAAAGKGNPETWFIHLNNTNPLWDSGSSESTVVDGSGLGVARRGQTFRL